MKSTSPKFFCFVLMPFDESFDDIYQFGIKETCSEVGAYSERVDEQLFEGRMTDRIYNQIAKADLVIADMTGRNPNVFYEVGYAHALNKPTVLLTQKSNDIPFDLKDYPHIVYNGKIKDIKEELKKRIEWFKENSNKNDFKYKDGLKLYVENVNLDLEIPIVNYKSNHKPHFILTMYNSSSETLYSDDFKIGIISDIEMFSSDRNNLITKMLDGKYIYMFNGFKTNEAIFPDLFLSKNIIFNVDNKEFKQLSIIIRLFMKSGSRDYKIKLVKEYPIPSKTPNSDLIK